MRHPGIPTLNRRFRGLARRTLAMCCTVAALAVVSPEASATEGYILSWGSDDSGQKDEPQPQSKCTEFASMYASSLCLKEDGSIKGWGYDSYGQVSDIPSGTGFTDIAAACYAGFAIDSTGSIVGWGDDDEDAISAIPMQASMDRSQRSGPIATVDLLSTVTAKFPVGAGGGPAPLTGLWSTTRHRAPATPRSLRPTLISPWLSTPMAPLSRGAKTTTARYPTHQPAQDSLISP